MQNIAEKEIVKKYVKKNRQERIWWEFCNSKKRKDVIWRFHSPDIFKENCLQSIEYMDKNDMKKRLSKLGAGKEVYYIGESIIGSLTLNQAVEYASMGEICIIYCGKGIGYYQGEQEIGKPPRYLLIQEE